MARIAVAAVHDEIPVRNAVIAVKACEQVNASLYSEAKIAALLLAQGQQAPTLGDLPIGGGTTQALPEKKAA